MLGFMVDVCARMQATYATQRRRNVEKNLKVINLDASPPVIHGIFRNHTRNIVEMFTSSRRSAEEIRRRATARGLEVVDDALAAGRGIVLVTVHVGNWEFGAHYLASLGYRLYAVAGVQMNRLLTGALSDAKQRHGITVVNPDHSYRKLFRALESNGIVALLLDGDIFMEGAEVTFFNRSLSLPAGAVRLARKTGAAIVGAYCRNLAGRDHLVHFERVATGTELARLADAEALRRIYGVAETFITRNYDQWCMFRDFWEAAH
jgi:KDO2-lipid IV(A) lauroyltransferase